MFDSFLEWLADSVSGLAAFVGGTATGAGLTAVLVYPTSCTIESGPRTTCENWLGQTPWDKDAAGILIFGAGLILGIVAAGLRDVAVTRREQRMKARSPRE